MISISLVQLPAVIENPVDHAEAQVRASGDADLIVLPEIWYPGYFAFDDYAAAAAQTPELIQRFSAIAAELNSCLHIGSLIERHGDYLYNTSILLGPDGAELGRYRKIHLFGYGSREQSLLTCGNEVVVVNTPLGRLGLAVCYDLRFPEQFRRMTERGAQGVIVASAWPHPRVEAWSTLLRARALENQAFIVACNGVGPTGHEATLCGRSAIIDPWGCTVASLGDDPATITASVDLREAERSRSRFPALADRRLLSEPDNDLVLRCDQGTVVRFSAERLILAGYTGRDTEAVNAYIKKLETEGIAAPDEVPSYFVLGADRLTTAASIEVATASSCGEVEYALLVDEDEVWVAVASDHTDRALETLDIAASKQSCVKVLSEKVWRLSEIEDHWDDLIFEAWNPADDPKPYQSGSVAALLPPYELLALVEERFGDPMTGTVILSGTIAALRDFDFHPSFKVELRDPTAGRSLIADYSVINVLAHDQQTPQTTDSSNAMEEN